MRSRYRVHDSDLAHFVTSTVVGWLPVFTTAVRCTILTDSLEYCRAHKKLKIYAWVILDNYWHAIMAAPNLPQVLADLKRHTAQKILEQLKDESCEWLLDQFSSFRAAHKTESQHQFWQEGFHPQEISDDETMRQKLDYLHDNPVKRGLVAGPEHWRYSSAHEWCVGATPLFRCDSWL